LTFLEQAVIGLSDPKKPFVQFRQSKLTHLLKDSIGGNCITVMIANIWPEARHMEETVIIQFRYFFEKNLKIF
jgi:kinesin family member 6/9